MVSKNAFQSGTTSNYLAVLDCYCLVRPIGKSKCDVSTGKRNRRWHRADSKSHCLY